MNGIDFLADTNAILYALEEHPVVRGLLRCLPAISVISEIELLGKKGISQQEATNIRNLIAGFPMFGLTNEIKEMAISLRQQCAIKTPDAIIAATAIHTKLTLVTADKGFKNIPNLDVIILDLHSTNKT
ncbi:hypothetical protein FACS189456_7510 [Bacteroidia bacterium]|nr:hypothetical protein FACS189456_7510 [Bacteroidia bacterium]